MPRARTRLIALGLGLAAALLAFVLQVSGLLAPYEQLAMDRLMRLRGPRPPDPRVVLCDIDAASIDRYGRFPWRRDLVATLLDRLSTGGAKVIALDLLFSELGPPAEDEALERAIARSGRLVLGYFFRRVPPQAEPVFAAQAHPGNIAASAVEQVIPPPAGAFPIPNRPAAEPNLDRFAAVAASQGFFNQDQETGVMRHYRLLTAYRGDLYPALALRAAQRFLDEPLAVAPTRGRLPAITLGGRRIEADETGALWIDYRGPAGTYRSVPAMDVLEGRAPAGAFRGRLVLVGVSEVGVSDRHDTPLGAAVPGVEIHATVADALLNGRFIHDTGLQVLISLAALLLMGPLTALAVVAGARHLYGFLTAVALLVAWPALCYAAFTGAGWHLQMLSPLGAAAAALVLGLTYRVGFVERTARQIKRTFQRYVSGAVVEEMLRRPELVKLGGERREMTVLFCDVRGFTSISEGRDPQWVVQLLNEFFTPMTRVVLAHGGTLDKYMGDALMAFFGAPVPHADHAARACRAACAMRAELVRLNAAWRAAGRFEPGKSLGIGIGLNSGTMSVGNMGSEDVFDYTVIGDNVNLGSRLEGLNRLYGTEVIASEFTVTAAGGDGLLFRELDRVRVKGKQVPVAIYEVMGERSGDGGKAALVEAFARGLAAYRARDFAAAEAIFAELAERGGDAPSAELRDRCREYLQDPPPEGWEAVETLTSK
jgi:adenylate cyclase